LKFRQRDVTRAVKGTVAAGCAIDRVEIDERGKIVVFVGTRSTNDNAVSDLDRELAAWEARHGCKNDS
jgi:hypothetical protein